MRRKVWIPCGVVFVLLTLAIVLLQAIPRVEAGITMPRVTVTGNAITVLVPGKPISTHIIHRGNVIGGGEKFRLGFSVCYARKNDIETRLMWVGGNFDIRRVKLITRKGY